VLPVTPHSLNPLVTLSLSLLLLLLPLQFLQVLWVVSTVLAAIACLSSLLLLWGALDSANPVGMFAKFGLPPIPYPEIITMIYLKVSISDFLTLFCARTHHGFFWSDRPSPFLAGAATVSLGISTLVACVWGDGEIDHLHVRGLTKSSYKLWPLW
jgi:H+-transporting ATPase